MIDEYWYKDAIIYELHIKAFKDGNGDGIGDFKGILEKLDYLQELGITTIWVLPFYPSPLKDDGYDISDYYSINPSYGNIDQFKEFLNEAHKRNLKVITELVINHTSDQHPWFQRARQSPRDSVERNYYVWTDNPDTYKDVRIIFQDFESSNWSWDSVAQQYYWHRFFHHQPDLNYNNPVVQEEVFRIIDFWCTLGVDGFRLDAVPYLFEKEGTNGENLPETHDFLKKLRKHVDAHFPGTVLLAEANMWPEDSASYFGNGDECHMNYHFPVMPRMFMSLQREDRYPITDIFEQTPEIPENCQWAMFLRNHDELTLEMVTDEERDYMYKVYAKDPKARINLGIRHRLAPLMDNDRRKIELMNSLLFSMPGTPVIYYGDEIGMGDNYYLGDRDGVRTPMQWSPDRNAGFSGANPHRLYLPVILDPEYNYEAVNVETQQRNTSSLLWYMKRLISMRKKYKAFGRGNLKFVKVENPKVLAFTRTFENESLLIIVNLSKFSQPGELYLPEFSGYTPVEVFSKNRFPTVKDGSPYFFTLGPHSFQWFKLEELQTSNKNEQVPFCLHLDSIEHLMDRNIRDQLENDILPVYLNKVKWFSGKLSGIYSCSIIGHTSLNSDESKSYVLIIEVNYGSGLPETYQLAVSYIHKEEATGIMSAHPEGIICSIKMNNHEGYLCDAVYTSSFRYFLFESLAMKVKRNSMEFESKDEINNHLQKEGLNICKIHPGDEDNTSINYDNLFFLKIYRKIDKGNHPDVEMTRYLSERSGFHFIPNYLGSINWKADKDIYVLGMLQTFIENHGDGRIYMLERINNYIERILAGDRLAFNPEKRLGRLTSPASFEDLPEDLQSLIGSNAAEQSRLIGVRTGQMHLALASSMEPDFTPEPFSLHYQRSLYSTMVSLVREMYQSLEKNADKLPEDVKKQSNELPERKSEILNIARRIYSRKLDIIKTRIHGSFQLRHILLTGKDISIQNFSGDPFRNYSERRLKRSPLRDVSYLIRSFYYVAYEGFNLHSFNSVEEKNELLPFAWLWAFYMSSFFVRAYINEVKGSQIIPINNEDLNIILQSFLLERAIYAFNYELKNRPDKTVVPLRMINSILNISLNTEHADLENSENNKTEDHFNDRSSSTN